MLTSALDILKDLNVEQRAIVKNINGSYLVLSGPGSGKTRCLVSRTQYMIRNNIDPASILLFTFTNKAANEIRERIQEAVEASAAEKITIGTYHSVCLRILKKHFRVLGLLRKNFSIYDQDDCYALIKRLAPTGTDYRSAMTYISRCKDHLISTDEALTIASVNKENEQFAEIYKAYQSCLLRNNAIDFDDIIYYVIKILENHENIRNSLVSQFRYITSDETQDASVSNIRLLELLTGNNNNTCMFLDDDQSIYGFRGADIKGVLKSASKFTDIKIMYLSCNYRSTQSIVNASISVINNNKSRMDKALFTENTNGDKIICFSKYNKEQEASNIYEIVKYLTTEKHLKYDDIAILYRNNTQSKSIEQQLLKNSIPYTLKNSIAFTERKEIKDLVAYLRLIVNHYDYEAFKRVINVPKRGLGVSTIEKISKYLDENSSMNTISACNAILRTKKLGTKYATKLKEFVSIITFLSDTVYDMEPYDFIKSMLVKLSYSEAIKEYDNENFGERYTHVLQFANLAKQYVDINDFISMFTVSSDSDEDDSNKVTLSTMHGCKGLEWPAVIVAGLNDPVIPGYSSVEEERRLFYVAITRARQYLFLSSYLYDKGRPDIMKHCRFIDEIDSQYITTI